MISSDFASQKSFANYHAEVPQSILPRERDASEYLSMTIFWGFPQYAELELRRNSMRIIGGEFRSRVILAPETDATRPITDRVKQSLFDIVSPLVEGTRVYDCFAGTGSMGLECLSRGALHSTFFEMDRSALGLLRKNIAALSVGGRSAIVDRDLFKWFDGAGVASARAGLIFLDPPYQMVREDVAKLSSLVERMKSSHLADGGTIVFRHDATDRLSFEGMRVVDERVYGGMMIELLRV